MARMRPLTAGLVLAAVLGPAHADENLFGYVYGAETLPRGVSEAYLWWTHRSDKGLGHYAADDLKMELEHGFTDRAQASLYLNFARHDIAGSAPIEDGQPEYPDRHNTRFSGVQASFKYNVLSPVKDPIGLALYIEPGYSRVHKVSGRPQRERSIEFKLIAQKNFLDDQLVWAFNLTPELEWRRFTDTDEKERELELEATTGLSYRFAPKWFAGIEARYHSEYPDFAHREHWALFAGPTLHYGDKHWWATLTWLPQIKGSPADPARSDRLHLDEHEKSEIRFKLGYNF